MQQTFDDYLKANNSNDKYSGIFYNIYNTIIGYEDKIELSELINQYKELTEAWESQKLKLEDKTEELENARKSYQDLTNLLSNPAKERTTEDYAKIFETEAQVNQKSSESWLRVAIGSIVLFCLFIFFEDKILSIPANPNSAIITIEYIKRLLIISFFIYVITFIFKQYSIKKHLETLNTHRQNTLNSYNLFIKSMGTAEQDMKNALMVEVARAIYESGQTGYINSKDDGPNSSSIMEVTKFIKPSA